MNIYVGNISWNTDDSGLKAVFEAFGQVESATIIKDRNTGRSKGFGFVEMPNDDEANAAISGMNGKELDGRELKVNMARPREGDAPASAPAEPAAEEETEEEAAEEPVEEETQDA